MDKFNDLALIIGVSVEVIIAFILSSMNKIYKQSLGLKDALLERSKDQIAILEADIKLMESKSKLRSHIIDAQIDRYTDFNRTLLSDQEREALIASFINSVLSINKFDPQDADIHLSMAKVYSMGKEWAKAIEQFELAIPCTKKDWNTQMLYGIACANSRNSEYYLKSVEAYSSAIAYIPDDAEISMKARLYVYRGSMFKRLNRLDEALTDLNYALNATDAEYETSDALYNVACIYAMQNNKKDFDNIIAQLETNEDDVTLERLRRRVKEYAPNFIW